MSIWKEETGGNSGMYDACVSNIYEYKYVTRRVPDKLMDFISITELQPNYV